MTEPVIEAMTFGNDYTDRDEWDNTGYMLVDRTPGAERVVAVALDREVLEPHAQLYVVIVGDGPVHYEPGEDQHDGVDELEVRGPFTQDEATDYAMRLGRYMVLVVPLNPASTPDAMLTASR